MSHDDNLEVSHVHTICQNCVFAKWESNEQTGCKLNKLDDYRDAGITVFGVEGKDGKKFSLIDGRFCVHYRNEKMMEKYPRDSWEDLVKIQTKIPYQIILFVEPEASFKDVKNSIIQLKQQSPAPNLVTIVNRQYVNYANDPDKYIAPSQLLEILQDGGFHQYNLKNIYDETLDYRALVDLVFDGSKSKPLPFYVTFKTGFNIPENFSKDFNNSILIKMLQLGFVRPVDEINGMIVNKTTHKKHGGNSFGINLEDKILKFEDNGENFIYNIGEVCQDLK